jgi:hypothetical protein
MDALRAARDVIILWDMRALSPPGINRRQEVSLLVPGTVELHSNSQHCRV